VQQPNILIITTDQQRWDALSLFGQPGYRTPNLDTLAREGIWFHRAYTPSPVCTPARVSMLTGQYSTRHGAYEIGMEPVPALEGPTIGTELGAAGYRTALIGKTHFVARKLEARHVAGWDLEDETEPDAAVWESFDGPYCGFDFIRHCGAHNANRIPAEHYRSWLDSKDANLDELHNGPGRKIPPGKWDVPHELTQNAWIAEEAIDFIDHSSDRPWCVMANFQDPHYPMVCPEPFYSDVDMEGVDLGGYSAGEFDDRPPMYRRFIEGEHWSDSEEVKFWDGINVPDCKLYDHYGDVATAIRAYIGMCNMVDHYIGKIFEVLRERGQWDNTLIIFTSDHGELLGRHGMWGKGVPAFDDNQRIPAIMHWPAAQKQAIGRSDSHFNLVDILPTVLDAAGVDVPDFVQGVSQVPVLTGERPVVRDWALVDHYATVNLHQQTLVTDEWKIVTYRHADYGELYDLHSDPDQRHNLWDDAGSHDIKNRLLLRLVRANMEAVGKLPERIASA